MPLCGAKLLLHAILRKVSGTGPVLRKETTDDALEEGLLVRRRRREEPAQAGASWPTAAWSTEGRLTVRRAAIARGSGAEADTTGVPARKRDEQGRLPTRGGASRERVASAMPGRVRIVQERGAA